jgi:hypothetical protein
MKLTITTGSPTFVLSYDHQKQAISAHFSHPYPNDLLREEREAMDIIANQFTTLLAPRFIHQAVTTPMLQAISAATQQILDSAYYQTGVEFLLDDKYLASQFSPIKRWY